MIDYNPTMSPTGIKITGRKKVGPSTTISQANHEKLVSHLNALIRSSSHERAKRVTEMRAIETDLLGVARPDGSDCERDQKRREGRGVSTPDRIYPFGYLQLQKYAADLSAIIMPYEAPYATVAGVDQQDKGDAIAKALRHAAALFDHRNNVHASVFDALALNLFGLRVSWQKHGYAASVNDLSKGAKVDEIYGPVLEHLDPYNITYDSSIPIDQVAQRGEFFAEFSVTSKFQIRRMIDEGQAFATNAELDKVASRNYLDNGMDAGDGANSLYGYYFDARIRDARHDAIARANHGPQTNFTGLFGSQPFTTTGDYVARGVHVAKMLVRLNPAEFGLANEIKGAGLQIYEITMIGDGLVVYAQPAPDSGGRFNVVLGTMSFGRELGRDLTHGAAVSDLSAFASNILNTYKHSKRKGLEGGVTLYNPDVIPLDKLDDMHGGRLPTKQMRTDDNIARHVMQLADAPDTKNSLNDAQAILGILDGLLPNSARPEMAGLDRATEFQAQAVAMTGDRELMYHAVMFDGQGMTPIRWLMQFFILNNADSMSYVDEKTNQLLQISAQDIQGTSFMLTQPSTLIGVDRLRVSNMLSGLINMTLQAGDQMSPLSLSLIKHFIDLSGMPVDLQEYQAIADQMMQQQQEQRAAEQQAAGVAPSQPAQPAQPTN